MNRAVILAVLLALVEAGRCRAQFAAAPTPAPASAVVVPDGTPVECQPPLECGGGPCGPPGRVWAEAEFLLWWQKGFGVPPLVTTSTPGTPQAQAGVLGAPSTTTLFGNENVNGGERPGMRFRVGGWFDAAQTCGIQGEYFLLGSTVTRFAASSPGDPILARPFFNAVTGAPDAELVAFPGVVAGSVLVNATSSGLLGAGVDLRQNLCCGCRGRLDVLVGWRTLHLSDGLGVTENLTSTDPNNPNIPLGTNLVIADRIETHNDFNGINLGLTGELNAGPLVVTGLARVALGYNRNVVDLGGSRTVTAPGGTPNVQAGGLLALSSNSGRVSSIEGTAVPELGVQVGYAVLPRVRLFAGYSWVFWPDVVRPGHQIDLTVNPGLLPPVTPPVSGPNRPALNLTREDFWAQGITFGLECRY
jgi:hypothetical protein